MLRRVRAVLTPVAVLVILLLVRENAAIRDSYARLAERSSRPAPGTFVSPGTATATVQEEFRDPVAAEGTLELLFFFDTQCPYCRQILPGVRELVDAAAQRGEVGVRGISSDPEMEILQYLQTNRLKFPVTVMPAESIAAHYRIEAVPSFVLVAAGGRVVWSMVGRELPVSLLDSVIAGERFPDEY